YEGAPWLRSSVYRMLERRAARWTDALITLNRDDERSAVKRLHLPEEKVHFVHGLGVRLSDYPYRSELSDAQEERRTPLGLPVGVPLILMEAPFSRYSGYDDAITAFSAVWSGAHLLLKGHGMLKEDAET